MDLREQIKADLKGAIMGKRELEVLVLRQLSAALLNKEKEKQYKTSQKEGEKDASLTDEEIMEVVSSEAKKRREAVEGFKQGGRMEQSEKEAKELEIISKYLPEQLSEDELRKIVKEVVDKVGAKDIKDMGKVMAELMPKTKGKADGSLVSRIVKEAFQS